jgi:NADP-dependent 3-hydroxy acid dehydrogenase YdfG
LKSELGLPVHVVHYGAASETQTALPRGSLRHSIWEAPGAALRDLVANNCETLLNLLQEMKRQSIFEGQSVTKVVAISAVAAIRSLAKLSLDNVQKGAGHSLLRTMALELTPEQIYITEIMPGSTDGGYYDNEATLEISLEHSSNIGYGYSPETKPVFTADQIGDAVRYVMNARCNVRELVLIPYGQYPHLGA